MLVKGLSGFRESLRRVNDGTEALLILTLFILCLDKVSTDSAKLVPLGKVCTAKETLEKNTAKALISLPDDLSLLRKMAALESCPKHNMIAYLEKTEGNAEFHEFWTSAKSKIINNVRHITAKVAGKSVSISEASIRTDLLFDDADGINSLPNQAIFDAIQLMGYEGDLTGKHFSRKVTPLFSSMLVQPTEDEGAPSERPSEAQPTPSPAYVHIAWLQSVSLKQRLARKRSSKKHWVHKESVSKQGRKSAKGKPLVHRDPLFDHIPEDTIDHMETENAQVVGRTRDIVGEEKEIDENILSTEDVLSTDKEKVSTDKEKISTDRPIVSTDGSKVSTDIQIEGTDEQIESTDEQRKGTKDHTEEGNTTQVTQTPTST
ncbi:hypothetical protein Tco_1411543, partial [Tanacetum coccineum]